MWLLVRQSGILLKVIIGLSPTECEHVFDSDNVMHVCFLCFGFSMFLWSPEYTSGLKVLFIGKVSLQISSAGQ